ncbi:MAG: prepilin-type N-terminal cleavage/methylation domain-containing protein [Sulfurimonas sp.]
MMRRAMTMIEVIFAIVIIAISIMAIPSMMEISSKATKGVTIDDDILKRMSGELTKIFQTRWDGHYLLPEGNGALLLNPNTADLNCSRGSGGVFYRLNLASMMPCSDQNASAIPSPGNKNLQQGIEQINDINDTFNIADATGTVLYHVPVTYRVSYVNSTVSPSNSSSNTVTATWVLGSSGDMTPAPSSLTVPTHLKRIVATASSTTSADTPDVNITLTFFKSNKGN